MAEMSPTTLFGLMMGGGMLMQAGNGVAQAYYGNKADQRWAQATEFLATTRADAEKSITQTNANMLITTTGMQVMAMMYQANLQYSQQVSQMAYMDLADKRQTSVWKMQLNNDIRAMTLALNAQIHADNLSYDQKMTEAKMRHEERMKELDNQANDEGPVDESTFFEPPAP